MFLKKNFLLLTAFFLMNPIVIHANITIDNDSKNTVRVEVICDYDNSSVILHHDQTVKYKDIPAGTKKAIRFAVSKCSDLTIAQLKLTITSVPDGKILQKSIAIADDGKTYTISKLPIS